MDLGAGPEPISRPLQHRAAVQQQTRRATSSLWELCAWALSLVPLWVRPWRIRLRFARAPTHWMAWGIAAGPHRLVARRQGRAGNRNVTRKRGPLGRPSLIRSEPEVADKLFEGRCIGNSQSVGSANLVLTWVLSMQCARRRHRHKARRSVRSPTCIHPFSRQNEPSHLECTALEQRCHLCCPTAPCSRLQRYRRYLRGQKCTAPSQRPQPRKPARRCGPCSSQPRAPRQSCRSVRYRTEGAQLVQSLPECVQGVLFDRRE
jgi:hypothetical protein